MRLLYPELLLLILPAAMAYAALVIRRGHGGPLSAHIARGIILALLLLAAAGPVLLSGGAGTRLVVVIDRSLSMPDGADARSLEILSHLQNRAGEGDRIGVVTFGERAAIERSPSDGTVAAEFTREIGADGSDLDRALNTALQLFPPGSGGRILVISDGEYTGESPRGAALTAAQRSVQIDYRHIARSKAGDVAVESVDLPRSVEAGRPFQFPVWVYSDRRTEISYQLLRGDILISQGRRTLNNGRNRLEFRDVVPTEGMRRYTFIVNAEGDPIPENNVARAALRVEGKPRVLVINTLGEEGNLARSIRAAGIECEVESPNTAPVNTAGIMDYRAVILENVSANALGGARRIALASAVTEGGIGLLVTGGRSSFGMGGYFRSELDSVLPVSMELREEQRKMSLALGVVLDRSGSMRMPVGGGMTKMDLANLGTAAAIEMLGDDDSVFVLAVDTQPHVIVPLSPMSMRQSIIGRVRRIESMGGGIFVYTGLKEAGRHFVGSTQATRHIILFSDAADSEEPGDYRNLLADFQRLGITVSVIGVGRETDVDADFLIDVARRGGGRIVFTDRFEDLPKLFAEETMAVSRSSFIQDITPVGRTSGVIEMGVNPAEIGEFPAVGGYNLTYLRPQASLAYMTLDEMDAPLVAFWHRGLGRAAAVTAEVDGEFAGGLGTWGNYSTFFSALTRWIMGDDEPAEARATLDIRGYVAELKVEFDPENPPSGEPMAFILPPGGGDAIEVPLRWDSHYSLSGRVGITDQGPHVGVVRLPRDRRLQTPPAEIPYSPEFAPGALTGRGRETLETLALTTGGRERVGLDGIFAPSRDWTGEKRIGRYFVIAALILFLFEIAAGRLGLWQYVRMPSGSVERVRGAIKGVLLSRSIKAGTVEKEGKEAAAPAGKSGEKPSKKPGNDKGEAEPGDNRGDVLERAKRRAGQRFR